MSRSLSARCLHRTVFSLPPAPSQPASRPLQGISLSTIKFRDDLEVSGARQYSYAAFKTRSPSDREYPRRQVNSNSAPHEPGIRLQQEESWGHSRKPREREPPRETGTRRRLYEDEGDLRERGRRADVGAHEHDQRGEGSSTQAATSDRRYGTTAEQSTRPGPSRSSPPPRKPDQIFAEHLNGLFQPLKFPQELSARVLTHASHPAAFHGHNAQFSFIGAFLPVLRRVKKIKTKRRHHRPTRTGIIPPPPSGIIPKSKTKPRLARNRLTRTKYLFFGGAYRLQVGSGAGHAVDTNYCRVDALG